MIILSMFYKHKEGGFNRRLYRMYRALASSGHEVHYLSCEPFPLDHDHVHYHRLPVPFAREESPLFWFFFCVIAPIKALSIAWRIRPDRIAVFGSWYALFTSLPKILLGTRLLVFLRADSAVLYRNEKRNRAARLCNWTLEYLGLALADRIWTNIGMVRNSVVERYRLSPAKVGVIYNNIETINEPTGIVRSKARTDLGLDENTFVVSTSGIFYKRKNIDFLIRAFHASAMGSKGRLLIIGGDVGQAGERQNLEELAKNLCPDGTIVFTGWRSDSQALIAASDVFVLPTLHEGFPNSLLDAMSVGCPCLGSRIQEIAEVLENDELLFSLDSLDELAGKIRRAAEDQAYRQHLVRLTGARARKFCFDWNTDIVKLVEG